MKLNKTAIITSSSHPHYYVMDKITRELLLHGNLNSATLGLGYRISGIDFKTDDLIECDLRRDALKHLRRFKSQLKAAKFDKKYYENLVVVKGWVEVEVQIKEGWVK